VRELRGALGRSRQSLSEALSLLDDLPDVIVSVVEHELSRAPDLRSKIGILTSVLRHINYVLDFVEQHLAHGTRRELTESLAEEVRTELVELKLAHYRVILSHGEAYNFTTRFGDLRRNFIGAISPTATQGLPAADFALFKVPRLEGGGVQWRPLLLGHEVAHVPVAARDAVGIFDLQNRFDPATASTIPNPNSRTGPPASIARGLFKIAHAWATELICDAHALHRFGPSAVASLGEYLSCISGWDLTSTTHPPGNLRVRLLLDQLGSISSNRVRAIIAPWADAVPSAPSFHESWEQYLADTFLQTAPELTHTAAALAAPGYRPAERVAFIEDVADRLALGIAGKEVFHDGARTLTSRADVVNAVWLARCEGAVTPIDELGHKTLENVSFVEQWIDAGGSLPEIAEGQPVEFDGVPENSILSSREITRRLTLTERPSRLVIAPLMEVPRDSGIDLRLGTRFIMFRRSATATFDPLDMENDPRSIQMYVELSWKEQFILHPQETVLGTTLEYLVMPDDVSGQVITRSSYGRLGLLTATAVQVHAGFHGCLTLELVNLSTIPITLTPGERIAQLVMWTSELMQPEPGSKYRYPIGPEFSRVRDDSEAEILRRIRGS
jgi:deoxycytidine triphosphate deaminase